MPGSMPVEQHLVACTDSSGVFGCLRQQAASVNATAPYYSAPAGLR